MRSNTWRAIMLLTLTLVLVSTAMDAQAARRSSLAGNQFINDPDDMFAFPQLSHKYKNRVIFDLGQGGEEGSGSITFGNDLVWQFNTGKGSYQNTTSWAWGGTDREPMGFENPQYEWWDVGFAMHLGDTPFGIKINWQTDSNETTQSGDAEPTSDNSTSMFGFQVGTTLGSVELAAELGFGSYTNNIAPPDPLPADAYDESYFVFTLLGRGDFEAADIDWRYIGAFSTGSSDPKAENVPSSSVTAFRGSIGPVWGTPGEWEVAAYMSFDYFKTEEANFNGPDMKNVDTETTFPAYNMALEYYLNSWLVARGGVNSRSFTQEDEDDLVVDESPRKDSDRDFEFNWTLGLGVNKGNWGLDLALEEDNVHSGYLPLNGDSSDDAIAYMSAWLAW